MDREELEGYVERSAKIVEDAPQMDEANTKKRLVEPFVEDVLGWDGFSDIELEHSVQMGRNPKKVDYALTLEDTPVVFVEAKGLDTKLDDGDRRQITGYIHNKEGVNWGILTNGEVYEFFGYDGTRSADFLVSLGVEELPRRPDIIRMFSKRAIDEGEADEDYEEFRKRQESIRSLRDNKDSIASHITENVTEDIREGFSSVVETEAKEFVDRVVEELENGDGEAVEKEVETEETKTDEEDGIVLTAGETVVASVDGDTQADTMAKAVGFLVKERGLLDTVSVPYVPGDKKAILNDDPKHPNGEEMRGHRQISGGYYLDTHASKEQKERRLRQLAGNCGLGVVFNW